MLDEYLAADVDAERLAPHIGVRVVIRSDNDELVTPSASDELAHRLDAEVSIQPGARHFLADDGVTALPLLLDVLRVDAATRSGRV